MNCCFSHVVWGCCRVLHGNGIAVLVAVVECGHVVRAMLMQVVMLQLGSSLVLAARCIAFETCCVAYVALDTRFLAGSMYVSVYLVAGSILVQIFDTLLSYNFMYCR